MASSRANMYGDKIVSEYGWHPMQEGVVGRLR